MISIDIHLECAYCGDYLEAEYKPLFQTLVVDRCKHCESEVDEIHASDLESRYDDGYKDGMATIESFQT